MKITLRDYQNEAVDKVRASFGRKNKAPLMVLPTGGGKCLGKGTPVLMHSGHVVPVESIKVGDYLMGPDSQPRKVVSLARGQEMLYKVTPAKGAAWVCNESHILSLKKTGTDIISNISVKEYLDKNKTYKHEHKLWRVGVDFQSGLGLIIPPYILGLWLGDGSSRGPQLTTADKELADEWAGYGLANGYTIREEYNSANSVNIHLVNEKSGRGGGVFNNTLKNYGLLQNKHIPHCYKTASRLDRLELLAGIIDTDGYYDGKCGYNITQKNEQLSDGILFLAQSLGFLATRSIVQKKCHNNGKIGQYFSITISGNVDSIPCRLERKKSRKRAINKNPLLHGFKLEPVGVDEYYGFEIEGPDRLFLLGDFTVTHNTVVFSYIAENVVAKGGQVLILAHRKELIRQAANKLIDFGLEPSIIAPNHPFNPLAAVQVASVQTLVRRLHLPWRPTLIIVDECHHSAANTYTSILRNYQGTKILGVTATPCRSDGRGLGDIFDDLVEGPSVQWLIDNQYLAPYRLFAPPIGIDLDAMHVTAGDFNKGEMEAAFDTPKITGDAVAHYSKVSPNQPAVVFCTSVRHAEHTAMAFREAGYLFYSVDGKTDPILREQMIRDLGEGRIHGITNCDIISEGTDIPIVTTAILLRPTMSMGLHLQQCGRVLRYQENKTAIILDHAGNTLRHGMPCEPREWVLDTTKPKKKKNKNDVMIKVCQTCFAANRPQVRLCVSCGAPFPVASREVEEVAGELSEIDPRVRAEKMAKMNDEYERLQRIGEQRGYKPGWAKHVLNAKMKKAGLL